MSIKLMSLVWQDHTGTLTGAEKAVLLRMADFAADNGTQIFPTIKRIAMDTGYSERNVQYAIKQLVEKKYITKTVRTSKACHISNLYRINTLTLEKAAAVDNSVKKPKTVNKSVNKPCTKEEGSATLAPGVVQNTSGGGARVACDPPLIRHIDPPIAKGNNNCSKNEQQIERANLIEISQSKIPDSEKIRIMKQMKLMLQNKRCK